MPAPTETPTVPSSEAAAETPRAARSPVAWRPTDEPTLGTGLRSGWRDLSVRVRLAMGAALVLALALMTAGLWQEAAEPPSDSDVRAEAVAARTAWAAARRQAPTALQPGPDGGFVGTGTLEPGDAETGAGRYVDFLSVEPSDSSRFSVVVTSAAFRPDVSVLTPEGERLGASLLLGTDERAEEVGLRGPGRFEITVTSAEPGRTGAYEVVTTTRAVRDTLTFSDPLRADTLGAGTPRAGRYEAAYALLAEPDRPVILEVVSPAFRPRLTLLGPAGEIRQQRTLERGAAGDSLYGVVLRFHPGWDLPYTLLVSSDARGQTGPFAMELRTVDARDITPSDRVLSGTLGQESWLRDGRYVDAYRFRVRANEETALAVQSNDFAPAFRLWREETRGAEEVLSELNRAERARIEVTPDDLEPGLYVLEVTSAEGAEGGVYPGGDYTLRVESRVPVDLFGPADPDDPDSPRGWTAPVRASASGTTEDGETFAFDVSGVSVTYPGGDRTMIQVRISVRSVDYTGPWAPWRRFASQSTLMDMDGRSYRPSPGLSAGTGVLAEPGATRQGRLVFLADGVRTDIRRLVLAAPLGGGRTVPLRLDLPR